MYPDLNTNTEEADEKDDGEDDGDDDGGSDDAISDDTVAFAPLASTNTRHDACPC